MVEDKHQKFMNRKKLVYTGWTRAKEKLYVVGQKEMIPHCIKNEEKKRKTMLVQSCEKYYKKI